MSSAPRVAFFCRRSMYADESAIVGRALSSTFGIEALFVGSSDYAASRSAPATVTVQSGHVHPAVRSRSMIFDAAMNVAAIARDVWLIDSLLRRERPDAVVVFDDRQLRPDLLALRAARRRSIPSVLVPYAVSSLESDLFVRRSDPRYQAGPNSGGATGTAAARWLPGQVRDGILFYPAGVTVTLGALGHLPPSPWLLGANGADYMCVLGLEHREELLAAGVPAHRVACTGQASSDGLAMSPAASAELASNLRQRYELSDGSPLLMCAVPQHAEHGMVSWTVHREAIGNLFAALAASGAAVLLSLHPKSDRASYSELASHHGLRILDERLSSALAAADLFVAAFSSTVRWAIGLGIPAIVIDDLESGYQLYRGLAGVSVVDDHRALAALLHEACRSITALSNLRAHAQLGKQQVGSIDGRAAHRIAEVIATAAVDRFKRRPVVGPTATSARTFQGPSA